MATTLFFLLFSTVSSISLNHAHLHSRGLHQFHRRDVPPPSGWETKGCYTDDSNSRTLYSASTSADNMTTESCISYCSTNGYPLAGTEYARECYCGKAMAASAILATSTDCSYACSGNKSEICGGSSRISVYHNISDVGSTKSPATNCGPLGFGFLGCYVDSVGSRTLPYGATTVGGANNMTVANCVQACRAQNYQYAGVEYGGECYCGSSLPASSAPDGMTGCSKICNGNSTEYCGGPNRLNVYGFGNKSTILPPWTSNGCYTDSVASRTLRYGMQVPGGYTNMTIPACQTVCQANGYILAGLSYSQECWCDNSYQSPGAPATDGCNMACKGDPTTICGGSNRLNVYGYNGAGQGNSTTTTAASTTSATTTTKASNSTTTTTQASKSTTTTTKASTSTNTTKVNNTTTTVSSTTSSISATSTATIGNWTYTGCFVDNAYGRILTMIQDSPSTTLESCVTLCRGSGYTIAGIEYSTQCFCGNNIINGAVLAPNTDCNMACGGNSAEMCGAGNRMSIYASSKNVTVLPVPSVLNTTISGWTYKGCLAELQGGRVFSHFLDLPANNNVTGCISACAKFGYSAAGLQYGEQCFCGDDWDRTNAGVAYLPASSCSMSCPGDPIHLCGGPNAFSYYTSTSVPNWGQATGNAAGQFNFLVGGLVIPLIAQVGLNNKVLLTEKHGTGPPNSTGAYELDVSLIPTQGMGAWREMYGLQTDVFCSAGLTLPDKSGRLINIGGWSGDSTYGVRLYTPDGAPGNASLNDWQENFQEVSLQTGRWYPSAMQMANGSIMVIGGEDGSNGKAVPSIEVLPKPAGGYVAFMDWLQRTDPNNLYPFTAITPSGNIAVFYYNEARILSPVDFSTIRQLPNIPGSVENPLAGRNYPLEGTSMLLPQSPPYTDMRVLICGGSTPYTGLAIDNCVTISPDNATDVWDIERMPDKRVMTCITALPDGTYMILNGAHQGQAGFGLASDPAHMAMLYDPSKARGSRFTRMANTTIDRLYHSEAILLPDGRILVSGSDPEDNVHAQEYRFETLTPPYLMGSRTRPTFTIKNKDWAYGGSYSLTVVGSVGKISLMAAVASTHGNSMGQRTILPAYKCSGGTCTVTAPPNANVAGGPGWWMLFVMGTDGTPSMSQWVRIGGDPAGLGNWPNYVDFKPLPGV